MTLFPNLLALKQYRSLRTEFINHLTAGAARRTWHPMVIDYRNSPNLDLWPELRDGGKNCGPLRAVRHPIRSILHIAAREHLAFGRKERRTHMKIRVRRVRVLHRLACSIQKTIVFPGKRIFLRTA